MAGLCRARDLERGAVFITPAVAVIIDPITPSVVGRGRERLTAAAPAPLFTAEEALARAGPDPTADLLLSSVFIAPAITVFVEAITAPIFWLSEPLLAALNDPPCLTAPLPIAGAEADPAADLFVFEILIDAPIAVFIEAVTARVTERRLSRRTAADDRAVDAALDPLCLAEPFTAADPAAAHSLIDPPITVLVEPVAAPVARRRGRGEAVLDKISGEAPAEPAPSTEPLPAEDRHRGDVLIEDPIAVFVDPIAASVLARDRSAGAAAVHEAFFETDILRLDRAGVGRAERRAHADLFIAEPIAVIIDPIAGVVVARRRGEAAAGELTPLAEEEALFSAGAHAALDRLLHEILVEAPVAVVINAIAGIR